jgi:general stress protein YciG
VPRDTRKKSVTDISDIDRIRKFIQELGRQGGKKRSQNLTPERRREIARKAALARWSKSSKKKKN